jgi:hypothetical protein
MTRCRPWLCNEDLVDLSGASLAWISDRDGPLGTGSRLEAARNKGTRR